MHNKFIYILFNSKINKVKKEKGEKNTHTHTSINQNSIKKEENLQNVHSFIKL